MVRRHPYLRVVTIWTALLNAATSAIVLLLVVLVLDRGGSAMTVGAVNCMALAGGVIGAGISSILMRRFAARRILHGASIVLAAALLPVFWVPSVWGVGALLLVAMTMSPPLHTVLESYEVRIVPDAYSGRVSAATRLGAQALQWAGPLVAGVLADRLGAGQAFLLVAIGVGVLALSLFFVRSALSILDHPLSEVTHITLPRHKADVPQAST